MPSVFPLSSIKVIISLANSILITTADFLYLIGKLLAAVKSAICMKEKHAGHPKTGATLAKLFKSWLEMDEAARLDACGKDQRILTVVGREIADLGCPAVTGDITTWFEANRASENSNTKLSECHEAIKLRYRQLD